MFGCVSFSRTTIHRSVRNTRCNFFVFFRGDLGGAVWKFTAFVLVSVGVVSMQQREKTTSSKRCPCRHEDVFDTPLGNDACSPA